MIVTGDIRSALAASLKIPIELWKYGAERNPPCHHRSNVVFVATPAMFFACRSAAILYPTRPTSRTIDGLIRGFGGSKNGGITNLAPVCPI